MAPPPPDVPSPNNAIPIAQILEKKAHSFCVIVVIVVVVLLCYNNGVSNVETFFDSIC